MIHYQVIAFYLDWRQNTIVGMKVFSKVCSVCDNKKKHDPPPPHECPKSWEGSSGPMEPQGALDIWLHVHEKFGGQAYWK